MSDDTPKNLTLARVYPSRWWLAVAAWAVTLTLYIVGAFGPLMTTKIQAVIINESRTVSLVTGLEELLNESEHLLFTIIFVFCVVVPITKLTLLMLVWHRPLRENEDGGLSNSLSGATRFIAQIGKWAMLDVFVVAVSVVAIKLGNVIKVEVHYALFVFAASVIAQMVMSIWTMSVIRGVEKEMPEQVAVMLSPAPAEESA